MGSPLLFRSGPDDPGGGGDTVLRGGSPGSRQRPGPAIFTSSGLAQSRLTGTLAVSFLGPQTPNLRGKRRQTWRPEAIIQPGAEQQTRHELERPRLL